MTEFDPNARKLVPEGPLTVDDGVRKTLHNFYLGHRLVNITESENGIDVAWTRIQTKMQTSFRIAPENVSGRKRIDGTGPISQWEPVSGSIRIVGSDRHVLMEIAEDGFTFYDVTPEPPPAVDKA